MNPENGTSQFSKESEPSEERIVSPEITPLKLKKDELGPKERGQFKRFLLGTTAGVALLLAAYFGERVIQTDNSEQKFPTPEPSIRQRVPDPTPSPETGFIKRAGDPGTLTKYYPDGTIEVIDLTKKPEASPQNTQENQNPEKAPKKYSLSRELPSFEVDGHKITIHTKTTKESAVTGMQSIAVNVDGTDQSLLRYPTRDANITVPDSTESEWNEKNHSLTIYPAEWNIELLTYQWQGPTKGMVLIDSDVFQPMRDEQNLTAEQRKLPIRERAKLVFEAKNSEHRQAIKFAQLLIECAQTNNWRNFETKLSTENNWANETIREHITTNQQQYAELHSIYGEVHIDPIYFDRPGLATSRFPILDLNGKETGYSIDASTNTASISPDSTRD